MKTILLAILVVALIAAGASALAPTCPPGEAWGVTGSHQVWHPPVYGWGGYENGKCPGGHDSDTCQQSYVEPVYGPWHDTDHCNLFWEDTCRYVGSWPHGHYEHRTVTEGYWHHHHNIIITPGYFETVTDYGCVAVSCPAIPCPAGQLCIAGGCFPPSVCSILGDWTLTYDGGWIHQMTIDQYDPATGNIGGHGTWLSGPGGLTADGTKWVMNGSLYDSTVVLNIVYTEGPRRPYSVSLTAAMPDCQHMTGDGWSAIPTPQAEPAVQTSAFFPYTADPNAPGTCDGAIPEADIETHILEGRPLLISMESCGPNGCTFVDTFRVYSLYETGDPSCNSEATVRQYFTRCAMDSRSGIGPLTIPVNGEVERIRVIGAKDETTYPAATQLRVTITEAYTGRLVWPITTAERNLATTHGDETIYDHILGLDTDLSGCRPNHAEEQGWIFGIPTQVT